ncbi:SchA/CurD-like domain-containing protein [Amycolatopsis alba]|uniref:SchA/CurD n=1 Tax=Amycolatopsis alba DSM 44262 TaxID=1125972 RepID=A0A229R9Y9_AMYAL|nr:SchA/CurD-like domain-containing protein [Amycolatopsis alba]OXM43480.1 SchA/CurD [Amycolatopsis alba DSM 44262]
MPFAAISYDVKNGFEDELVEVFADFRRPDTSKVPSAAPDGTPSRILSTAVFIRDGLLVRFIEYEGDLTAIAKFMAAQPGVREVERKLKPYLRTPRDTDTEEGFVRTFTASLLRSVTQLSLPKAAASS